jgi:hypothetical protein
MPGAKINAIPTFVLPEVYKNRIAHSLPTVLNRVTDPVYGKYFPSVKQIVYDYAGAFNFAGGPIPVGSLNITTPNEIGLDLTDFAPEVNGGHGAFFLKVISKGGAGTIQRLALMDYTGGLGDRLRRDEQGDRRDNSNGGSLEIRRSTR